MKNVSKAQIVCTQYSWAGTHDPMWPGLAVKPLAKYASLKWGNRVEP